MCCVEAITYILESPSLEEAYVTLMKHYNYRESHGVAVENLLTTRAGPSPTCIGSLPSLGEAYRACDTELYRNFI